ncbi:MAG: DNA polymerase III subunit gamma/tau [Clostridia bacterium]|nr:DNA polymerase III subunit gamma/tau [Clostridia bacterium]
MAYQALYRRWRPMTFEQVLGQTAAVKALRNQIEVGRIAHAYLFCGCRGTGKTTLAKLMSRAVNCLNPNHGDPCGQCDVCRAIMNESTMDVVEMDAASHSRVEEMRELLDQVPYPPQMGRYKVYIIDEVHMLSTSAFNALLKTLEEPPEHIVFILATTEPHKLPATILSRVQRYDFGRIPSNLMVERMRLALDEMSFTAEEEALQMVARAAEGAMRDAFSILDMCVAGAEGGAITAAQVRDVLGTSDKDFLFTYAELLAAYDAGGVMRKVDELMRSGREPQVFLREMSAHMRALLTVKAVDKDAASILDVTDEDEKRYRQQAEQFSSARLLRILDDFVKAEGELRFASTPRIGLESASLRACQQNAGESSEALMERIGELEAQLSQLQSKLDSGAYTVAAPAEGSAAKAGKAAVKAGSAASAASDDATPAAEPAAKPIPNDAKLVWKEFLSILSKNEPPLLGLLRNERFLGEENDTYRVQIARAKKDFSYVKLNQPARKEKLNEYLSQAAGKPVKLEVVLEGEAVNTAQNDAREANEQMLFQTFGRENVQIDEGKA